jgi:hypothetical protein
MRPRAILSLFQMSRAHRPGRLGLPEVASLPDAGGRTDRVICPEKSCARLIWLNERSNPHVMDRLAAFRLQDVFRRPP